MAKDRIAAFGFRSIPPKPGSAGADKFAEELYTRLARRGYEVTGYNRVYERPSKSCYSYEGVKLVNLRTTRRRGAEALWHSLRATFHIVVHNTGDVVHIQNGGNSIFAVILRICGKRVFISEDGVHWDRHQWPWYGRLYLRLSRWLTAHVPNGVIFDNIFVKNIFEERYARNFHFVPFGSDPAPDQTDSDVLERLGLLRQGYFLFVGRFVPDKGLQYLIPAFEKLETSLKLVLVGGSLDNSKFEKSIKSCQDDRVLFPGFMYGPDIHTLMRNAYAYVQPSEIEGLSPVILENMGLGTPVICSDIRENLYVVGDTAVTFRTADALDLREKLTYALGNPLQLERKAIAAEARAQQLFSWDSVAQQHEEIFFGGR